MDLMKVLGDNYHEGMTVDEVAQALSDIPGPDDIAALKRAVDKATHEAATYKKDLRAHQSAEEQSKAEQAELLNNMKAELDQLRKEKAVAGYKAKYMGLGFDEKLAEATAAAMADGDSDTVFANLAAHQAAMQKSLKAQSVKAADVRPAAASTADVAAPNYQKDFEAAMAAGNQLEAIRLANLAAKAQAESAEQH